MAARYWHKMDRLSDRQLVNLLLANDKEAVEYVFFHRCDHVFAHVINSIFQSQVKKEELITEFYLFMSADDWRRLRQFGFRSGLDTWLTVVAIRFFRQKKDTFWTKTESLDSSLIQVEQIPDEFNHFDEISKVELYKAIEKLPKPRERLALLGSLSGKSAEMIAEELGCSVAAVYNLVKKAKMTLKRKLKGKG